eukprot:TRINITY_DN12575_c0_g2_i8.p1 TRINITY_DN12575_c0_g2~~TRINITY_DN12575_c0_g2_i8.p1  ORF type:complete len:106 (-),score=11.99 TRINITY_DN12575_c0_g2_i8:823-1140(-)
MYPGVAQCKQKSDESATKDPLQHDCRTRYHPTSACALLYSLGEIAPLQGRLRLSDAAFNTATLPAHTGWKSANVHHVLHSLQAHGGITHVKMTHVNKLNDAHASI